MAGLFTSSRNKVKPSTRLSVTTSVNGVPIPLVFGQTRISGNLIWYGDFKAKVAKSSSGKGGSSKSGSNYTYSAAVIIGLCQGPASVLQLWDSSSSGSLSSKSLTAFAGDNSQTPWGYLTSMHPDQALGYRGLAYVAAGPMDLGSSAALPNLTFEVLGSINTAVAGVPDANPRDVVTALLTDAYFGLPYPTPYLADLSGWAAYCQALGLFISPALTSQRSGQDILKDLLEATNSEAVFSGGKLTIVPYGDSAVTGNGSTWSPAAAPIYLLGEDDFILVSSTDEPVTGKRKRGSDAKNVVRVEYMDRTSSYDTNIAEAKDEGQIDMYGLQPADTKSWHFFCLTAAATMAAQLLLGREAVRMEYTFVVGPEYIRLDPMDIIAISSAPLGLSGQLVRITEITEGDEGALTVVAEEVLDGTGSSPLYAVQSSSGYVANFNVAPPTSNAPIVLAAPPEVAQGLELWIVATGPDGWGGCNVWGSSDDTTYRHLGEIHDGAIEGVLAAGLPAVTDPDITSSLVANLAMSGGELVSYSTANADLGRSLCYICDADGSNGEFIAYAASTLTGSDTYTLTYLRRGLYGTKPTAHAIGSRFAFLDTGRLLSVPYTKEEIGTPLFIKLTAFNQWGGGEENIADVDAYATVMPAPPAPPEVTGFSAVQSGGTVVFRWDDLSSDWALYGYDIAYASPGSSTKVSLTEAHRGTEMTNASVPPGRWEFSIAAIDEFDQSGPTTTVTTTVTDVNTALGSIAQSGVGLTGTLVGLLQHVSGGLVPDSRKLASEMTNAELFESFAPYPVDVATLTLAPIDTSLSGGAYVWANALATAGRGRTDSRADFLLDYWSDPDSDPLAFTRWTGGNATARYFRGRFSLDPSSPCVLTDVAMTVAAPLQSETMPSIAIAAAGTPITFARAYREPPAVQVTPATGATGGVASSITTTGATIQLFAGSTAVAGSASITVTGV